MSQPELLQSLKRLDDIVRELRIKCPWDNEQTRESLRHLTIEETYELADAILKGDIEELKVELGDLLLHIFFYALIEEEQDNFNLIDVTEALIDKLIRRHPHIYGDTKLNDSTEVIQNWEKIKSQEKKDKSILSGVPDSLPSLIKAYRMQEKASNVGFDWKESAQVWAKVKEEILEFEQADSAKDKEAEMGDLLFVLVNYCRLNGINPEDALSRTNLKFKSRFEYIERQAKANEKSLSEMSLDEMEAYWQEAKTV